jgi:ABC-type methionine transport system ATPase subunit
MYHVKEICGRVLWIDKGRIKMDGINSIVIGKYESFMLAKRKKIQEENLKQDFSNKCKITSLEFINDEDHILLKMEYINFSKEELKVHFGLGIKRADNEIILGNLTNYDNMDPVILKYKGSVSLKIENVKLLGGEYMVVGVLADDCGLMAYDIAESEKFFINTDNKGFGSVLIPHRWFFNN